MIAGASAEERPALQYGIYDPEERFAKSDQIGVEHIFVHWELSDVGRLRSASDYATSRNRWTKIDRKSTRLNSSHQIISYAVFCLKKKKQIKKRRRKKDNYLE